MIVRWYMKVRLGWLSLLACKFAASMRLELASIALLKHRDDVVQSVSSTYLPNVMRMHMHISI